MDLTCILSVDGSLISDEKDQRVYKKVYKGWIGMFSAGVDMFYSMCTIVSLSS